MHETQRAKHRAAESVNQRSHFPNNVVTLLHNFLFFKLRIEDEINSPKIAKVFGPLSKRVKGRILSVFVLLRNAEDGPNDKQDWGIYFVLGPNQTNQNQG